MFFIEKTHGHVRGGGARMSVQQIQTQRREMRMFPAQTGRKVVRHGGDDGLVAAADGRIRRTSGPRSNGWIYRRYRISWSGRLGISPRGEPPHGNPAPEAQEVDSSLGPRSRPRSCGSTHFIHPSRNCRYPSVNPANTQGLMRNSIGL